MSTESHSDYPNPERLARLMDAFDYAMRAKDQSHVRVEELKKAAQKQIEAMKDPSKLVRPHQSQTRRGLTPLYMFRYIRDTIRLRRYNRDWIKNNIGGTGA